MNFAQMLATPVKPLSHGRPKEPAPLKTWNPESQHASSFRHAQAVAKFRKVMGDEWVKSKVIETRLGYAQGAISKTLSQWAKVGLMERRPYNDGGKWSIKKGYEWRFVPIRP